MRKSGLTGDEAYILSKHGETTEDLGPLKKEIGLIKEDIGNLNKEKLDSDVVYEVGDDGEIVSSTKMMDISGNG